MDHSGLSAGPKLLCLPKLNTSRQFRFLWNNAQNTIYDIFWNLVNIQSKLNKQGIFMTHKQKSVDKFKPKIPPKIEIFFV